MENSVVEALILPWWKIPVYIVTVTLGIITIRISVKFDMNTWLEARRESKELRGREKASRKCPHIWTLYPTSPYSRCDNCLILISTSILALARSSLGPKPAISGQLPGIFMKPGKNEMVTSDYMGARDYAKPKQ